jgi:hypothetical protein
MQTCSNNKKVNIAVNKIIANHRYKHPTINTMIFGDKVEIL